MARSNPDSPELSARGGSGSAGFPQRWLVWVLVLLLTLLVAGAISGDEAGNVFGTLIHAVFLLPVLLPAWMLGILLTGPFAAQGCFDGSPWPGGFRSLVAVGLGLGVMALGMLLLGTLHLVEPGGSVWPAAILPVAAFAVGLVPTRNYLRGGEGGRPVGLTDGASEWSPPRRRGGLMSRAHRGDWLFLLAAVPAAILLIASTFPPGSLWASEARAYDVMEYHLQLPREYALNNSTAPLAYNVYSYLPANIEMLYLLMMQIAKGVMGGDRASGYLWGTFPAQFLHAMLTLLTAAAIALMPLGGESRERPWLHATGRAIAVVFFLGTPWTIVTGSLAYNEMGMLFFGTLALGLAIGGRFAMTANQEIGDPGNANLVIGTGARGILIGLLLGLAVGCKMTAGVFFALPVAAILAWRGMTNGAFWRTLAIATGIALVVYAPWAIRAAAYSGGNPVFPVASMVLPRGDWSADLAERFKRGHSPLPGQNRLQALADGSVMDGQWSVQPYALMTVLDAPPPPLDTIGKRLNLLVLIVPLVVVCAFIMRPGRTETGFLLAVLVIQLLMWLFTTHLEARFLLSIAVPLSLLAGRATQGLHVAAEGQLSGGLRIATGVLVGVQTLCVMFLLLPEAGLFGGSVAKGRPNSKTPPPIGQLFERIYNVADLVENPSSTNPVVTPRPPLPPAHILLLGEARAWYFEGNVSYFTVFDANPVIEALTHNHPDAAASWLHSNGIKYVWVDWLELARLQDSYGLDLDVPPPEKGDTLMARASLVAKVYGPRLAGAGLEDTHASQNAIVTVYRVTSR